MTTAEFNFYKTMGDSYEPCKFNALLEKIGKCKKRKPINEGRTILGVNALQTDTSDKMLRALKQWSDHIDVVHGSSVGNHIKIISKRTGNLITSFTQGSKIGPKTAIGTLSSVREELIKSGVKGLERKNKRESGALSQRRQSRTVDQTAKSAIPERTPEQNQQRLAKLKSIVQKRLGEKRAKRVQGAIQRTRAKVG